MILRCRMIGRRAVIEVVITAAAGNGFGGNVKKAVKIQ